MAKPRDTHRARAVAFVTRHRHRLFAFTAMTLFSAAAFGGLSRGVVVVGCSALLLGRERLEDQAVGWAFVVLVSCYRCFEAAQ